MSVRSLSSPQWMALGMALCLLACETPPDEPTLPDGSSLFLQIQSPGGAAVPNARIRLSSGQRFQTDDQGQLLLEELPAGQQLVVQVEAEGFFSTSMNVTMDEGVHAGARIESLPLGPPDKTFDTSEGAVLEEGCVSIAIPAGALVDAQGRSISGEVEAYLEVLDLENDGLRLAPGVQQGLVRPGLPLVGLESLGMMALVFKQKGTGLTSSLAMGPRGVSAFARRIKIGGRVPGSIRASSLRRPQASRPGALALAPRWELPLWRWDAVNGYWVPTGELGNLVDASTAPGCSDKEEKSGWWSLELDNPAPVFQVAMPYSWRSTDAVPGNPLQQGPEQLLSETACLEVLVKDAQGQPVAGREVVVTGRDYVGLSSGLTDTSGRVLLEVMRDKTVQVRVGERSMEERTGSTAGTCPKPGGVKTKPAVKSQSVVEPKSVTIEVAPPRCVPGATTDCPYNGPEDKLGKGICQAARRSCNAEGMDWGRCGGEVLPQTEVCDSGSDDNCDGTINEGCASVCTEGTQSSCYDGDASTEEVGQCRGGTKTCVEGGRGWSTCEGQVLPATEDCSLPGDEDCDGVVCECWPGESQQCPYTGPAGTEGQGACHAGYRTCGASGRWSVCMGEVTPLPEESCTSALDEDCDGQHNEAPCEWVATAGLGTARTNHSAVVLSNGHVLLMGGASASGEALDTAQVYDPAANTWTAAGRMSANRMNPGAVPLKNGQVLVVGGWNNSQLHTAEVYNPATRTWTAVGDMASARDLHTTTLLDNGKVLVTGGLNTSGHLDTAEVYDPAATTWSATMNRMSSPRALHAATRLKDGRVLVTGGHLLNGTRLASAEVYDPATNTWTHVASMNVARTGHTATVLNNGHVLVAGGSGTHGHVTTTEVYDPAANTWTPTLGALSTVRDEHGAVLLSTGHVLVAGGDDGTTPTATAELYDPATRLWTPVVSMATARTRATLVVMRTGEVLALGGSSNNQNTGALATAEMHHPAFQPLLSAWMARNSMTTRRHEHTATLLKNGTVLVAGGSGSALPHAEVLDPETALWVPTPGSMSRFRERHTATLLDNGKVLVAAGKNANIVLHSAELYDPATGNWSTTLFMNQSRLDHAAARLSDGRVLVMGGLNSGSGTQLNTAEVYDPATNNWSLVSPMNTKRQKHTAVTLKDGRVLVVGGYDGTNFLDTAEVYDPAAGPSGSWSSAGSMLDRRNWFTATLLKDGRVLVAGGYETGKTFLSSAEVYDPDDGPSGSWSPAGSMATAREKHAAVLLSDGRVLVTGGSNATTHFTTAEVYDPAAGPSGTWSPADPMPQARSAHALLRLDNGKVLVTGGNNSSGAQTSVLLYSP